MNILPYLPLILKAVAGKNVKKEMAVRDDVMDRPLWLSGRFIGTIMTLAFGSYAVKVGIDLGTSIDNVTELANLIYDNEELLIAVVGMLAGVARGVVGIFQRK